MEDSVLEKIYSCTHTDCTLVPSQENKFLNNSSKFTKKKTKQSTTTGNKWENSTMIT